MSVDVKSITQLREMTGAGMLDCKSALEEGNCDMDKAIEILRKKGVLKAAKKADRATKEGVIAIAKEDGRVAVVGLACETDFVARGAEFIASVNEFAKQLLVSSENDFSTWADDKIKNEMIVKIGENLQIIAAKIIEGKIIGSYLHSNLKVASVVVLNGGSQELANDLAMQVTAMSPSYIKPEDVDEAEKKKEMEIYREQLKNEGKNQAMWDKIIEGKLQKYYTDVCLLRQTFIKDDKLSIEKLIKQESDKTGEKIEVVNFYRFSI